MSLIAFPPKPNGSDGQAVFMRWVWESIATLSRVNDVQGVVTQRTTKGTVIMPPIGKAGGPSAPQQDKIPRWG